VHLGTLKSRNNVLVMCFDSLVVANMNLAVPEATDISGGKWDIMDLFEAKSV
jgi:hypothetical protein